MLWFQPSLSERNSVKAKVSNNNVTYVTRVFKLISVPRRWLSSLRQEEKKSEKSTKRKNLNKYKCPPLTQQVEFPYDKIQLTYKGGPLEIIFVEPDRIYPREKAIANKIVPLSDYLYVSIAFSLLMGTSYYIYDLLIQYCLSQGTFDLMLHIDVVFVIIFSILEILIVGIIRMHYSLLMVAFSIFVSICFVC